MIPSEQKGKTGTYGSLFLSLVVLIALSALSRFWLIMYFIGFGITIWGAAWLLKRLAMYAIPAGLATFEKRGDLVRLNPKRASNETAA